MFERFTDGARKSLVEAQQVSIEARHGFIGTEHLLLGLAREGSGLAHQLLTNHGLTVEVLQPKVIATAGQFVADDLGIDDPTALASIGIDFEQVRSTVEATFGEGSLTVDLTHPAFTPKSKHALEQAFREALLLRQNFVGTEHLLIGVVGEPEGLARQIVADLGLDPDRLLDETRRAAAPAFFRADALVTQIQAFEREHAADDDDATKAALQALSQGRVDAMLRDAEALNAATVAYADALEALLRMARASIPTTSNS